MKFLLLFFLCCSIIANIFAVNLEDQLNILHGKLNKLIGELNPQPGGNGRGTQPPPFQRKPDQPPPPSSKVLNIGQEIVDYYNALPKRNTVTDDAFNNILAGLDGSIKHILESLPNFGKFLNKFGRFLQSHQGTVKEPKSFRGLVNVFDNFFGPSIINNLKHSIQNIDNYKKDNVLSTEDKEAALTALNNLSELLNMLYEKINAFDETNIDKLQYVFWQSSFKTPIIWQPGPRSAMELFRHYIYSPLLNNAQKIDPWKGGYDPQKLPSVIRETIKNLKRK